MGRKRAEEVHVEWKGNTGTRVNPERECVSRELARDVALCTWSRGHYPSDSIS
jgi:hypothetical protein